MVVAVVAIGAPLQSAISPAGADPAPDPIAALPANATWLETLNAWRAASNLPAVVENTGWSVGDLAHSTYIVETGDFGHDEDNGGPYATTEGAAAGLAGDVAASTNATKTDRGFVEQWITAPFHAAGMLDPLLQMSGYGAFRHAGQQWGAAATLDVIRGRVGPAATDPTFFPGDGSTLPAAQLAYHGGESPDPLAPCPDYGTAPINTGIPLFVLLPEGPSAGDTAATLTRDGVAVDACTYDETSYTNPDGPARTLGRAVLAGRHQVVVIPREPIAPGAQYAVDVQYVPAGDVTPVHAAWAFTGSTQPEVSIGNASIVEGQVANRSVRVTVSLSEPATAPVTVHYASAAGTATADTDFTPRSGDLTFAIGATSAAISIPVVGDRDVEPNESLSIRLSAPQGATIHRAKGTVSIVTDDKGRVTNDVRGWIGAASIVEGNVGARLLRFTVGLSAPAPTAVHVHYAASAGTATAPDFKASSGTVTIKVKPDPDVEPTETFSVVLSDAVGATIDRPTAIGSILNDD